MKKILKVFLSFILVFAFGISSFASPVIDEGASGCATGIFTVSGTANPGELLLLRAIKPGADETLPESIFYSEIKAVDTDGNFSFSFSINTGLTGDYKMIVTSGDGVSSDGYIVRGVNEDDIRDIVTKINGAASPAAIKSLFDNENAAAKINLNTDIYGRINSDGNYANTFGIIFDKLYAQKETDVLDYNGTYIVNLDKFQTVLDKYSVLALLNQENSLSVINEFNTPLYFNLDSSTVASLDRFVTDKDAVKARVATGDYTDFASIVRAYDEEMILAAIKNNDRYQINSIVNATGVRSILGASFKLDEYNLSSKVDVDIAVAGKTYATAADFVRAFNDAIPTDSSSSAPGGFTSSSSSSGGGSVIVGGGTAGTNQTNPPYVDKSFNDLAGSEWATEAIEFLQDIDIVSGTAPNTFSPLKTVSREEFVKMLVLLADKYTPGAVCGFADVPSGHWASGYIASAVNAGLVNGIDANSFGTGKEISRQDACVLLARVIGEIIPENGAIEFTDGNLVAPYAIDAVSLMSALGVVNGTGDGTFKPLDNMTRAQAAKILYEMYRIGGFTSEK